MMDEKEAVRKIKDSLGSGMSKSEVIRRLQKRGYKLEYIDLLMKKAGKTRKVLVFSIIVLIVIGSLAIACYSLFFSQKKTDIANPLGNINVVFDSNNLNVDEVHIDDLEITPEFLSYLLNEVGAWKLHKNPLGFEKPIINFNISGQEFYSVIDNGIKTFESTSSEADMAFITTKQVLIKAMLDENPAEIFTDSIQAGDTEISLSASQTELFVKGYLGLYDSLKTN